MTSEQAQQMIDYMHSQTEMAYAHGVLLGQCRHLLEVVCILLLVAVYFLALRRNGKGSS